DDKDGFAVRDVRVDRLGDAIGNRKIIPLIRLPARTPVPMVNCQSVISLGWTRQELKSLPAFAPEPICLTKLAGSIEDQHRRKVIRKNVLIRQNDLTLIPTMAHPDTLSGELPQGFDGILPVIREPRSCIVKAA